MKSLFSFVSLLVLCCLFPSLRLHLFPLFTNITYTEPQTSPVLDLVTACLGRDLRVIFILLLSERPMSCPLHFGENAAVAFFSGCEKAVSAQARWRRFLLFLFVRMNVFFFSTPQSQVLNDHDFSGCSPTLSDRYNRVWLRTFIKLAFSLKEGAVAAAFFLRAGCFLKTWW